MKGKRVLSLALSALLALSLWTVPAAAAGFSDMEGHWAREDVEHLAAQGVVRGTSATTFAPDQKMTACEALLFCSRATGVSAADKAAIAADWADELAEILPEELYSWAAEEMAVCLETGILSETELRALSAADGLVKAISRETLAMYLVRAMQLDEMAQSLTSYSMSFDDTASISAALQPYVYLLATYGIVKGNEANCFLPQGSLTRAEMATMLRRAIDFMEARDIYAELPAYTDYGWVGGTIAQAEEGTDGAVRLTLTSTVSGTQTMTLPADVAIYENNMRATASPLALLQAGTYARVNLDGDGQAVSVRLGGAVTAYTGAVTEVTPESVTLDVNGVSRRLKIDRFTAIQADGTSISASQLDPQAGYTTAAVQVDAMGHLAAIQLTSSGRTEEGILRSVEDRSDGQILLVTAFNGDECRYTLPAGTAVTVDGAAGSLSAQYLGSYVRLRVSTAEEGRLTAVTVDTTVQYVQGTIQSVVSAAQSGLTLTDAADGSTKAYLLAEGAVVRVDGAESSLSALSQGSFATLRLSGGAVELLDAYPAADLTAQGVLEAVSGISPVTLRVRTDSGETRTYPVDAGAPPAVYRGGVLSSIDRLEAGDTVKVTTRGGVLTLVEAEVQSVSVTGALTGVSRGTSGVTLDVRLSDGSTATYQVADTVPVTRDGRTLTVYQLAVGDWVELTVRTGGVEAITAFVDGGRNTRLEGTVLEVDAGAGTLRLRLTDGSTLTVDASQAGVLTADGRSISLRRLAEDDLVQVFGDYSGNRFTATLVIQL